MSGKTCRLDRFISQNTCFTQSQTRLLIAQNRITVDGNFANSIQQKITKLSSIFLDGECLQKCDPVYIMLHKPKGVVSATWDSQHKTVLDLVDHPQKSELHIVGRLDFNTTGLVLLTNDGAWSRRISLPTTKLTKTYDVVVQNPITPEYAVAFQQGLYFQYENCVTKPAVLEVVSATQARLSLVEGKYHQVKRMFGFFQNKVVQLHREAVGALRLGELAVGYSRSLTAEEVRTILPRYVR